MKGVHTIILDALVDASPDQGVSKTNFLLVRPITPSMISLFQFKILLG